MAADAFDEDDYPKGTVTFLFTDVVESSRLWDQHHDAMQLAMAGHDEIVKRSIAENAGVFLKQTGDGVFAVFASAFDALAAVVAVRRDLAGRSWGAIEGLDVRIGLHTGEAELRDGDYFGPTVSRAARVMGLAEAGEMLLSLATEEVVRDRLPAGFALRDLGERDLRGFARPEHVFLLAAANTIAEPEAAGVTGPPAADGDDEQAQRAAWIAVLPFENMSGDPDQEYFADGISEDVITGLAAFRSLRVIARTSSFRYKGSDASIPEIAEDLGVRFVLEGSVRKSGSRIRVTAQLIETDGLHHVWADRYDADLEDIFEVQDQITRDIVIAIDPAIRDAEVDRVARVRPDSLDAWDHVQRGWSDFYRYKTEANNEARGHFESAIELDPTFAQAHAGLSYCRSMDAWLLWVEDPTTSVEVAYQEAKKAIELDSRDAMSHGAMALTNYAMGRLEAAARAAGAAIDLNPSLAVAYMIGGVATAHGGDPEAGIRMLDSAIALSPHDPTATWFYGGRAIGHFLAHHLEEAVADAREAVKLRFGYLFGRVVLTASLAEMGLLAEARQELEALLGICPGFTPVMLDAYTFSDEADRDRLVSGLRSAGLQT